MTPVFRSVALVACWYLGLMEPPVQSWLYYFYPAVPANVSASCMWALSTINKPPSFSSLISLISWRIVKILLNDGDIKIEWIICIVAILLVSMEKLQKLSEVRKKHSFAPIYKSFFVWNVLLLRSKTCLIIIYNFKFKVMSFFCLEFIMQILIFH